MPDPLADFSAAPYVLAFGDSPTQGYGLAISESFAMLREFARCGIAVLLATMQAPLLLGELARMFNRIYDELGAAHAVPVHPFFPTGVMAHPEMVLRDRIHPNARAIAMVARAMLPAVRAAMPGRAAAA